MGSQSSKLVTETQLKHEHAINYMNSGGSMGGKSNQSLKQNDVQSKDNKEIVNTIFRWNFGGQKVYVSGTFNQWKNPIQLQKEKGGEFSTVIPLPKGIHHYKFIVDGEWRFSPDDPTAPDEHGNINNIVDTTQQEVNAIDLINSQKQLIQKSSQEKNQKVIQQPKTQQPNQDMNFADQAPPVPPHLLKCMYVEEKEKKLHKMWSDIISNRMEEEGKPNISPKDAFDCLIQTFSNVNALNPPPHVSLNHLSCVNQNKKGEPYNIYCLTHRFKAKYTTLKYFTHKYTENKHQLFVV